MNRPYLVFIICLLLLTGSCGPSTTTSDISTESEEYTEEEEENTDDRSKRPSPPRTTTANVSGVNVTIDYSSPAVKGREIFGKLEPYGKVWRTGANEATVLTIDGPVNVNGENLEKGQYALFAIPGEKEWTVIFNKEPNQWGAFNYSEAQDALRIVVKPIVTEEVTERLNFSVSAEGKVDFAWEKVSFSLDFASATEE